MSLIMILNNDDDKQGWTEYTPNDTLADRFSRLLHKCNPLNWEWVDKLCFGLRNIWWWMPTIYRDRDYDSCYLFEIMRVKIMHMSNHHKKYMTFVGVEDEIDRMDKVVEALQRLIDDQYYDEIYGKQLNQKWGDTRIITRDVPDDDGCKQIEFVVDNVKTHQQMKEFNKQYNEALQNAQNAFDRDLELVCDTIKHHSTKWWD